MASSRRDVVKRAILHEKQEQGSMLCAQHALNNLLQGHYFDPAQLAEIATQLDQLERNNLDMTDAEWNERESAGRNADETGFFSVGVIETALQVWGLSLLRWNSADMRQYHNEPEKQLAFVLNLESHWFSFRSFGTANDLWFNLNSFLEEPTWVGTGYLGALLDQSQTEGYSVFVVTPTSTDPQQAQTILSQIRSCPADVAASTADSFDDEDEILKQALAASLAPLDDVSTPTTSTSIHVSPPRPRRKSKRQGDEGLQEALIASMRATAQSDAVAGSSRLGRARNGRQAPTGTSRETAISLDDDDDADDTFAPFQASSRSPFLDPALRDQMVEGGGAAEEMDNLEMLEPPAPGRLLGQRLSIPNRSFIAQPSAIEITSDDEDIDSDGEDRESRAWRAAASAFENLQDRDYDDEDTELQRALAASIADPTSSSSFATATPELRGGQDDFLAGTCAEEQARILEAITARRAQKSPTPADVGRIAKMREEAKRKETEAHERAERRERGIVSPTRELGSEKGSNTRQGNVGDGDGDDEEEEEEEDQEDAPEMSAEELRKIRLARFAR